MNHDSEWQDFVEGEQRKLDAQPEPPRMLGIGDVFEGIEAPPFEPPTYVKRCNAAWRAEHKMLLDAARARWKAIIVSCIAGDYGKPCRDLWLEEYSGFNPDTVSDVILMQAAQAVWIAKGSKCVEKMPELRTMLGKPTGAPQREPKPSEAQIPPMPDFGYRRPEPVQSSFADLLDR